MNWQPEMDELRRREGFAETSLSFLGVGIRPPLPSVNFVGDDLRDALDPRQARQGASNP